MSPSEEKKLLRKVLKQLDAPNPSFFATFWPSVLAWCITVVLFIVIFQASDRLRFEPFWLALISALVGSFVGITLFLDECSKNWPVMRNHLNRQSIESRLAELET